MNQIRSGSKRPRAGRRYAWGVLGAGAAVLAYSLSHAAGGEIPGWTPVNVELRAKLETPILTQPPSESPDISAALPKPGRTSQPSQGQALPTNARPAASSGASGSPVPATESPASRTASAGLNLNAATEADLDSLPGIGPAKAKTILAYRDAHHGFRSVDDLLQVKGIGPKLLEKIRSLVAVAP